MDQRGLIALQQPARQGYGPVAYVLARIYRQLWLRGNTACPDYEYWLGYMHEKGLGVKTSQSRAAAWHQSALLLSEPGLRPMRMDQSPDKRNIVAEHNNQVYKALARLKIN